MNTRPFFFAALTLLLVVTSTLQANNIVIYKGVYTEKGTTHYEENPDTANAIGAAPFPYSYSLTYYLIVDLTAKTVVRANYGTNNGIKELSFNDADEGADANPFTPANLLELYDNTQRVKGRVPSFLWSGLSSTITKTSTDGTDTDTDPDLNAYFDHGMMTGIGVPFALGNGSFIQNVAPKISGTWETVSMGRSSSSENAVDDMGAPILDDNGNPIIYAPSQYSGIGTATETVTLDAVMTKAANLTAVPSTSDMGFPNPNLAAGTMENGLQRVRDALAKLGFTLPPI